MDRVSTRFYVAALIILAAALAAHVPWEFLSALEVQDHLGLLTLFLLGTASESSALRVSGTGKTGHSSITFLPAFAAVLLFGPPAGILLLVGTGFVADLLVRRKEVIRVAFNASQYTVATATACQVYERLGGAYASVGTSQHVVPTPWSHIMSFVAFTICFLLINHIAVSLAISISQRRSFGQVWRELVGTHGYGLINDVIVSPFAIVIARLYQEVGVLGIGISVLPLLFIRYSYVNNFKLQQAQESLLTVLIKAIETRDPYTSGHSYRVSALARSIAKEMGLSHRQQENAATAGLLHDIGKIDSVFAPLLDKDGTLTHHERLVIESHPVLGAEMLESLGSFAPEILLAVRHHHESIDGTGYPDRLSGGAIPPLARIIKVSDSIDAMLSDRPYRPALPLSAVRSQLLACSGSQFDARVVDAVLGGKILDHHRMLCAGADDPRVK